MKINRKVKVFTLPNEECLLNELFETDGVVITEEIITPCPKEGIILYLVKFEDPLDSYKIY